MRRLLENQDLLRYLMYTDSDPLSPNKPDITAEEAFGTSVKAIPDVSRAEIPHSIICLRVASGTPATDNLEFKEIQCHIGVFVPMTQWTLKSDNLRPFLIMSEIEKSLQGKSINGLGIVGPMPFELSFITPDTCCYEISFTITEYV